MSLHIYQFPSIGDSFGTRRPFEDDDGWVEDSLYARRHDGLYESRLEATQREIREQQDQEQ